MDKMNECFACKAFACSYSSNEVRMMLEIALKTVQKMIKSLSACRVLVTMVTKTVEAGWNT